MRISILFFLLLSIHSWSQQFDPSRFTDWSLAGMQGKRMFPTNEINFLEVGGLNDGKPGNDEIIKKVLKECKEEPLVIYFPEGTYYFQKPITLTSNTVLKGADAEKSRFKFNLNGSSHCIQTVGKQTKDTLLITESIKKGDEFIEVTPNSKIEAGNWIRIIDNDHDKVYSSWARGKTGQIVQVESLEGTRIKLKSPTRRDYLLENNPKVVLLDMNENIGIESMTITREDPTKTQTDNIHFRFTVNSWVKDVKSYSCNYAHVRLEFANNCEIIDSFFKDGHSYGSGGKAYGIACQFASGECLIQGNTFEHLRHSMLLQAGANGNVFSNNTSSNPYWEDVRLPSGSAGEITLHGNYVYCNLFDNNRCGNIIIDASHGLNGPYNTFIRNYVDGYGIIITSKKSATSQNFIGNEIVKSKFLRGKYKIKGENHFEYGNKVRGKNKPKGTSIDGFDWSLIHQ